MTIKTVAIIITEENYPMAVAALPPGFASIPLKRVLGRVMILNTPRRKMAVVQETTRRAYFRGDRGEGESYSLMQPDHVLVVALGNDWMSKRNFKDQYKVVGDKKLSKTKFREVKHWK